MKLEIIMQEEDFLAYQLYSASKSVSINKKLKNGRLFLTLGFFVLGVYLFYIDNLFLAIYFGFFAVVTALFYPMYFKRHHKKHYQKHIREHYATRFGEVSTLEFTETEILSKDKLSESKIKLSSIEVINEISTHIFLKLVTNMSLIIPKRELIFPTEEAVLEKFRNLGLTVNDEKDWKW